VEFREHEREQADFWANRALSTARRDPARLAALLTELGHAHPKPSAHLGEQLLDYLRDEDSAWGPVRGWLETVYDLPLAAVFQQQNVQQASEQVALANAIGSLRLLTHLRWQESFERLSAVEDVLRTDPAGVYPHMDFATRDRYRRVVEAIARAARVPETTVAAQAIALASGDDGTDGTNGTDGAGKEARGEGSHCHPSPERPATGRGRGEKRAGGDWDRHVG